MAAAAAKPSKKKAKASQEYVATDAPKATNIIYHDDEAAIQEAITASVKGLPPMCAALALRDRASAELLSNYLKTQYYRVVADVS